MTQLPPNPLLEYRKSAEGLRMIAARQRAILLCILVNILLYVGLLLGQNQVPPVVLLAGALAMFGVNITATVFVFMLATKLYGAGIGIVLGILVLIPCINLITLLMINGKATAILKENGIKVGLLGAKVPDHL